MKDEPAAILAYLEKRTEHQQQRIENVDFRIKVIEGQLSLRIKALEDKVAALERRQHRAELEVLGAAVVNLKRGKE